MNILHHSSELARACSHDDRKQFADAVASMEQANADYRTARNDDARCNALDRECSARLCAEMFFERLTGVPWARAERVLR